MWVQHRHHSASRESEIAYYLALKNALNAASPRLSLTGDDLIVFDSETQSATSVKSGVFKVSCSGWPSPNFSTELCRVDSNEWKSFESVVHRSPVIYNSQNTVDARGVQYNTFEIKIDYFTHFLGEKLRFVCSNEHGNSTSNETTFFGTSSYLFMRFLSPNFGIKMVDAIIKQN